MTYSNIKKATLIPWLICALGAFYYCYEYFLRISPSVMMPQLMRAYGLTGGQVGGLSAFYYHAYVPMQIMVGLLMDRYGPRRLLTLACLCCAVGTLLFGSGYSLEAAEIGRFLVGFGSAFAFVGALKLATIWLPPNRFALISGIILCLGMIGAMMGDIVMRIMVDQMGWQVTIFSSAIAGIALATFIGLIVRDRNPYLSHGALHTTYFKDLLSGLWGAVKNPQIWLNGIVGTLLYLSLTGFAELWGIPYLEQARGLTRGHAATANSMVFLGWAVGGPFWGWFSDFIGRRCLPIILSSICALISVCILLYSDYLSVFTIYCLLFIFGLFSSVQILIFAICREATHIKIAGTAIALTNMFVMVGGNISQPFIGRLLDSHWSTSTQEGARAFSVQAYQYALGIIPLGIILAIVLMFFVRESYCKIKVDPVGEHD